MNKVISKRFYSENVAELIVEAPLIAQSRRAGHFVIIRVDENSERVPLTIADADIENGTITLVAQRIGVSTAKLCALESGDYIHDVVGPLGKATDIRLFGTVVLACGGVGAAPTLPIAQALKAKGNRVITVLAARTESLIIMRSQLEATSDEVIIMTDDGSLGQKGVVTVGVEQVINRERVDKVITIGPAIMMKFVALTTAKYNIPTDASLNTIMVDGTGMCGACRITLDGETKFVCVDGPEFDAHKVNWDEMMSRLRSYKNEESSAYEKYLNNPDTLTTTQQDIRTSGLPDNQTTKQDFRITEQSDSSLSPKQRTSIPRVKMPELDPIIRAKSLHAEVNQGLTLQMALTEASRCLDCKNPTCVSGCPVNINIPAFIHQITLGDINKAADIIHESSTLPAVCGRVCPQEKQCEAQCIYNKMHKEPIAIGYLERFVADHAISTDPSTPITTPCSPSISDECSSDVERNDNQICTKLKVAVVGSGPAGLTAAGDLAKYGYDVTVFEALHELGGVLRYGIPEYRLPNAILDKEIEGLRQLGVHFLTDTIIGKTISMNDLAQLGYKAVFVGSGAGLPKFMGIPGENLNGVLSANEYLTRVNLMDASSPSTDTPLLYGKRVIVVGGGNTAMDAVRTAKRLGAERATLVYRRSEAEMPARLEEVHHAKDEGIEFLTLHNPIEYIGDESGRVSKAVLQVMELGEPDASGRRSPVPVEGQTITLDVDLVIVAVGVSPNPLIPRAVEGLLEISKKGTIVVDDNMRSVPSVHMDAANGNAPIFAGGDIVRGGATVILAMSDGRKAAASIHDYLSYNKD